MKRLRVLLSAFTGVLSCAVGPGLVYAQVGVASVVGVVSDDSGSPVPLAVVTVVSSRTGLSRAITCDEGGAFTVPALPPGLYEVQAEATGFRPLRRSGIWLATGETIRRAIEGADPLEHDEVTEAIASLVDELSQRRNASR